MNVVKILLIIGLGYVATTQKSEKTKNMLLVVTGLLAFCMFSMEGFTVNFSTVLTGFGGDGNAVVDDRNITVGSDEATQIVYNIPSESYDSTTTAIPGTGYSCTIGGNPGVMGKYTGEGVQADNIADSSTGPFDITKIFTCEAAPTGPSNGEQRVGGSEADPCNCLTAVDGKNLYCNSGWMNSEILEYMGSDGKKTDKYEDAHKCWSGTLDFIPKLGDSFVGRCTKKSGSGPCTAPAATGGD